MQRWWDVDSSAGRTVLKGIQLLKILKCKYPRRLLTSLLSSGMGVWPRNQQGVGRGRNWCSEEDNEGCWQTSRTDLLKSLSASGAPCIQGAVASYGKVRSEWSFGRLLKRRVQTSGARMGRAERRDTQLQRLTDSVESAVNGKLANRFISKHAFTWSWCLPAHHAFKITYWEML